MRIVQLDIDGQRLEFHPYMTVLRGLQQSLRDDLVHALGALAHGEAKGGGMVEAHGVFLDLSEETLALLDLPKPGTGSLDLVVRAGQLPRALGPGALAQGDLTRRRESVEDQLARAEAEADRARLTLATTRAALDHEGAPASTDDEANLAALRAELGRRVERRKDLEAQVETANKVFLEMQETQRAQQDLLAQSRQQRAEAGRVASDVAQALEAARARRDPFAPAAFDVARDRLRALQTTPATDGDIAGSAVEQPEVGAVERLELREAEIEAALLALDTVDPFTVEAALDNVVSTEEHELVPSVEAQRLADEWVRNEAALAGEGSVDDTSGHALAAARLRLDAARAAVFEAERAVRVPEVDRLDVEALENAHEAVLVAQERADKRFGGDRARQKLDEVRATERAILDRLGYDTYASFMMGTSIQHIDAEREIRLDMTRAELAAAEDALAQLEHGVDVELAHASLLARRRTLQDEAARLLGRDPGDDIEWELRHHRVEAAGGGGRTQRLKVALEHAGVMLHAESPSRRILVDLARIWLDEQRASSTQREELAQELSDAETALDRARHATDQSANGDGGDEDPAARRERIVEEAHTQLREAEGRLAEQSRVEAEIGQRKADLAATLEAEQVAAEALSVAEQAEVESARQEHDAMAVQAGLQAELSSAFAAERDAIDGLSRLTHLLEDMEDGASAETTVADAESAVTMAVAAVVSARTELEELDKRFDEVRASNGDGHAVTSAAAVEELEWYLLSRLAGQRSLSYAGSLPFVLDEALEGVRGEGLHHLLSRLERMSSAVQVVIVSEDNEIAAWADAIGADRAVTLYPVPL